MRCVVDANIAFKWEVPEQDTDKALRLRDEYRAAMHEFLAPDFYPVEVGHALARAERQKRIQPPDGWAAWLTIMADKPVVYDCVYIALAERENCELVTADAVLVAKFQARFPFIIQLDALP